MPLYVAPVMRSTVISPSTPSNRRPFVVAGTGTESDDDVPTVSLR